MTDFSLGDLIVGAWVLVTTQSLVLGATLLAKKAFTKGRFKRFLGILGIGLAASMFPFGPMGLAFGGPAVLVSAIAVSWFLDKEDA